jgi:FkbM family methyltransferase
VPADAPECVVATNEHGLYCVPLSSSHRPVAQTILQSRVWEADTLNFLRWCDPAGDVLHAGTFFGDFLPALAHTRDGGALVWAFEPGAENFRCTQITIELNDLDNVVLVNRGLGAAGGRALLATGDRRGVPLGGGSKLLADPARAHWWENEQVELVAADDVIGEERAVAAIHLDVEGYERQALEGALGLISRCRPPIIVESLPAALVEQDLAPLGYRLDGGLDWNYLLRCP